jgi:aspartate carbamoyltransferase regulatory subunit
MEALDKRGFLAKDFTKPDAEPYTISIGINMVTTLEINRQTVRILVILHLEDEVTKMALIDSRAGGNFIDTETVERLQLARIELR